MSSGSGRNGKEPPQVEEPASQRFAIRWLIVLFIVALLLRVGTASWLVWRNHRHGIEHEFADSELYWKLALNLAAGRPYDDGKRQVLRTPGYPIFLAGCIRIFGETSLGARHAQASIGSLSCVLLFWLVRRLLGNRAAWLAACGAAVYPFAIFLSGVLLSESVFTAVLLVQLLCLAHLRELLSVSRSLRGAVLWSALAGLAGAAATLVRPSWFLVVPLLTPLLLVQRRMRQPSPTGSDAAIDRTFANGRGLAAAIAPPTVMLLSFVLALCPWWIRNWNVTGHFVATTLWVGASLYDGCNEHATGASNMEFMEHPEQYGLAADLNAMNEWEQDQYLRDEAWKFVRARPGRMLELAAIKFSRFWNPLPNATEWRSWPLRILSLLTYGPVLVLAVLGAWRLRRQGWTLVLLAGPVLYFSAIHLVFVSSVRYREAAILPVFGLAAAALVKELRVEGQELRAENKT